MRVLHLDTEKTWRGGENQVKALIHGLIGKVEKQWAAAPVDSIAIQEKRWDCELLALSSGNPYDPRNIFKLVKEVKYNKIQIIDAHSAKAHTLALYVKSFCPNIKVVVHRRVDNRPKDKFLTRKKYLSSGVDHFVAISSAIADILIAYGVPQEKISVVKSAVDAEIYNSLDRNDLQKKMRLKFNIPQHFFIIGNASALSNQKGYPTLIRAAARLKALNPNFRILIAGEGSEKSNLEQLVHTLDLHSHVLFLGFLKNVPEFLSSLDILAIPSNNEGLGTVILDAILAGCCPVGSRVGGIPEIILDQKTGLLVEVGDHEKLALSLNELMQNPEKLKQLSQNARKHVLSDFSLESMVMGNFEIYKTLTKTF